MKMMRRNRALLLVQTELVLVLDGDLLPQVAQTNLTAPVWLLSIEMLASA